MLRIRKLILVYLWHHSCVTAQGHSAGPGDRLKSWAALSKHTDTPVQFQHSVPRDLSPTNPAHAAPLHSLVESHKETERLTAKVKSAGKLYPRRRRVG